MTTLLLSHPMCERHEMPGSPEVPLRLLAIDQALMGQTFAPLQRLECPTATIEQLALAHDASYIDWIRTSTPETGYTSVDPDTSLCPYSFEAALRAAGGAIRAVDAVITGEVTNAFCAVRPPGHHAEGNRAMGFCIFNNAAIAALHARKSHGVQRIAVIDFDVHHGNGTQSIFWNDKDLFLGSSHQMPLYPGSGERSETGVGNIFNAPLSPGATGREFRDAYETMLLPALSKFEPELLIVSAGFDGHADDPLSDMKLSANDFRWLTSALVELAADTCGGRIVSVLEGGYDLRALSESVAAHVDVLLDASL